MGKGLKKLLDTAGTVASFVPGGKGVTAGLQIASSVVGQEDEDQTEVRSAKKKYIQNYKRG